GSFDGASKRQSPTSCCSHSCSFRGFADSILSLPALLPYSISDLDRNTPSQTRAPSPSPRWGEGRGEGVPPVAAVVAPHPALRADLSLMGEANGVPAVGVST